MKKVVIILLIVLVALNIVATEVTFTASSPKVVALGEQFRVTYTMNAKPASFRAPDFKDFSLLAGPSTSSNTSIQYINGQMTRNNSYTYTYVFRASSEGEFSFPPAEILVEGEKYYSEPIKIEVIKDNNRSTSQTQNQNQNKNASSNTNEKISDTDLFVRVLVNKNSVYQGEHIVATIKLYTKINLSNIDNAKFPSFSGFLKQDIETPQISLQQEKINGQIYGAGVIQRVLLFPQKTGEIIIDPFELDCIYQKRTNRKARSMFDEFFNNYQNVRQSIKSKPVRIRIKPLPAGKPLDFAGAVGQFQMGSTINKSEVQTNDAITLKIKISGNGNLKLIDPLKVKFPADFETYDPKSNLSAKNNIKGSNGSKTFEYLVIPRYAGNYVIPPINFAFFDPQAGRYRTVSSPEYNIIVNKGEDDDVAPMVSGFSKENVRFIGKDIRFIKHGLTSLKRKGDFLVNSANFYLTYLGAIVAFLIVFFLRRKKIKENADLIRVKNKKANKYAQKRLKQAFKFLKLNDREQFYEEVLKAIWGYLSDKLDLPVAELSKDSAISALQKRNIEQPIIDKFVEIIDNCEFARYAPSTEAGEMDTTYNETIKVISKLQQKIK